MYRTLILLLVTLVAAPSQLQSAEPPELKNKLAEIETKLSEVHTKVDEVRSKQKAIAATRKELGDRIAAFDVFCVEYRKALEDLNEKKLVANEFLTTTYPKSWKKIEEGRENIRDFRAGYKTAWKNIDKQRADISNGKKEIQKRHDEVTAAAVEVAKGQAAVDVGFAKLEPFSKAYEKGWADIEGKQNEVNKKFGELKGKWKEAEQKNAPNEVYHAINAAIGDCNKVQTSLCDARAELNKQADTVNAEWKKLSDTRDNLNKQTGALNASRDSLNKESSKLDDTLNQIDSVQAVSLNKQYADSTMVWKELDTKGAELNLARVEVLDGLKTIKAAMKKLGEQYEMEKAKKEEAEQASAELVEAGMACTKLVFELQSVCAKLVEAKRELEVALGGK